MPIIDANVSLSRWPFRRVFGDEPQQLMGKLRTNGVTQAWAGSLDALLHRDLGAVNHRLAVDCRRYGDGMLLPFGCVNPMQPDWMEDLRRCGEEHRMQGIRLHPSFHGYTLDAAPFRELLAAATARRMIVQIAAEVEDERTLHPIIKHVPLKLTPLAGVVKAAPGARVLVSNFRSPAPELLREWAGTEGIYVDFAMIEGAHGLERLSAGVGAERVLFGSYFPFYYHEGALLKLKGSGLDPKAIQETNARRLLGDRR